jgi:Lrp/AsnC family transcriptional regulator, leucine-responsive regulatory protein
MQRVYFKNHRLMRNYLTQKGASAMDDLDRRILNAVQTNAERTMAALAQASHSTAPTCHRRYQILKRGGVIRRIVALVDGGRSREPLIVLLGISIRDQSSAAQQRLRRFVQARREIKMAWMTTGELDYVLLGAFADMATYLSFVEAHLQTHADIAEYRSFISLDEVKFDTSRLFA